MRRLIPQSSRGAHDVRLKAFFPTVGYQRLPWETRMASALMAAASALQR